jgi:hypothetical protein
MEAALLQKGKGDGESELLEKHVQEKGEDTLESLGGRICNM